MTQITTQNACAKIIRCRNYTNYNPERMRKDLSTETFNSVYTSNNPNTAWQNLKGILQKTFDQRPLS